MATRAEARLGPDAAGAFARQVETALEHLHDLPFLQRHPLAALLREREPALRAEAAGRALQRCLLEAIEALRSTSTASAPPVRRAHAVLVRRYVEGEDAAAAGRALGVHQRTLYRAQAEGLAAVMALLAERWGKAGGEDDRRRTNLPRELTSFVGRERELETVAELLTQAPLVTLTGAGGVGKTRLALRAAAELLPAYADGVWLVDLAPLADATLVPHAIAAALGFGELPGRRPDESLVGYMRARTVLVVLDNCEHLVAACARLAEALLRACPRVTILATSRELLGIAGETTWRVPSLSVPADDQLPAEALAGCEAVRLFVARARAIEAAFAVTDENAPALAQVCRRLDGIPLAIELAAARVRVLTVEQIAARLDERFRLLTGGGRTALPRQQTLRALVDWSHDLLPEKERVLFRRLAVFAGGWSLEGAEAVCRGDPIGSDDVLDLLTGLVDKSLVVADQRGAEVRYELLETMRRYTEDKLRAAGEAAAVRDRHRDWCLALVRAYQHHWHGILDHLALELDNFRAALAWCAADDASAGVGLALVGPAAWGWTDMGGTHGEARKWLEAFLARAPEPTASRARALIVLGHYLRWLHEFGSAERATAEALGVYQALHDERGVAVALGGMGLVAGNRGDYPAALAHLEEAIASARRRNDVEQVVHFLRDVGVCCIAAGDFARARTALVESGRLAGRGSLVEESAQLRLALLDRLEGDVASSRTRLTALRRLGGVPGIGHLVRLAEANLARAEGRFDEARTGIAEVLLGTRGRAEEGGFAEVVAMLGICEVAAGALARGVALLAAASNVEGPIGSVHMPDVRVEAPAYLEVARSQLGDDLFASAWAEGRDLGLDAVAAYIERAAST